ncbi:MAG: glycosyltransferase [Clostridiales bacterium]|nr:glycosyltransferase [Clostridiales bacterium]
MAELISVIVPIYNVEKYLSRCIDSILNQTYKNLEIILVDDGSTDNCGKICDEYVKKDNRIRVIHQANSGLSMARNTGLDIATGDYIGFVDSDDYIHPQMYEILSKSLIKNNADLVFSSYKKFEKEEFNFNKIKSWNEKKYINTDIVDMECTNNSRIMAAWNKLYKKTIFEKNRYEKGVICEDAHILIDILNECSSIVYISEELYYYSIEREDSIMRDKYNLKILNDELKAYKKMLDFFEKNKYKSIYIGFDWVYFKYITKIREHYYKVKKNFPKRNDILYKLLCEYLVRYNFQGRKRINNIKIRHRQDRFYLICKFTRMKFLNIDLKKACKSFFRKCLVKKITSTKQKKIFLIGTPEHGNLGDHAISVAAKKFLDDNFCDFKLIEITSSDYCYGNETIKSAIRESLSKDDIILVSGGGFLGSLWLKNGEEMVRDIIISFDRNKIVILPQTIFFEDNEEGKNQLKISKSIYESHKNLVLCVREKKSFEFIKNNMPNVNVKLIPDMVFYLKENKATNYRKGAIVCFRNDKEKIIKKDRQILDEINANYKNIVKIDTVSSKLISVKNREKVLKKFLEKFKYSEIVYTDRLHGMLFAYITNTPFIAFDNLSGKIRATFETWISDDLQMVIKDYNEKIEFGKYWEELVEIIKLA